MRDARAVAAKLPQVGFAAADIALVENPTLKEFTDAVDSFSRKLAAGKGAGIFYFSGHGAQVDGENYLIPGSASVKFREHLKARMQKLGTDLTAATEKFGEVSKKYGIELPGMKQ